MAGCAASVRWEVAWLVAFRDAAPPVEAWWAGSAPIRFFTMRRILSTLAGLSVLVSVAACGGNAELEASDDSPQKAAAADEPAQTRKPEPAAECLAVPQALAQAILDGEEDGAGLQLAGEAAAVKSPDYAKAFFIAIPMQVPGVGKETGVWVSNSLKVGGGIIMAGDSIAQALTVWPDGDSTDARIDILDPSVKVAKRCL